MAVLGRGVGFKEEKMQKVPDCDKNTGQEIQILNTRRALDVDMPGCETQIPALYYANKPKPPQVYETEERSPCGGRHAHNIICAFFRI